MYITELNILMTYVALKTWVEHHAVCRRGTADCRTTAQTGFITRRVSMTSTANDIFFQTRRKTTSAVHDTRLFDDKGTLDNIH